MTGYGKSRQPYDFYPTPRSATVALLNNESFDGSILEPASGEGHISKVLEEYYPEADISSYDIQDDCYGIGGVDFLNNDKEFYDYPDNIITNPPYVRATEFILQAKEIADHKVAMLLKLNALAGLKRYKTIWTDKRFPLKKIIILIRRPDFKQKNSPTLEYAWAIFDKYWLRDPVITWGDNSKDV
jgi:methylase of polypeptide subunit release factors